MRFKALQPGCRETTNSVCSPPSTQKKDQHCPHTDREKKKKRDEGIFLNLHFICLKKYMHAYTCIQREDGEGGRSGEEVWGSC